MSANLWQKFLEGDDSAFADLYRHFFNELFAYGLKIGFNEEVCKDAIQDIFCKLFTNRRQLAHVQNIEFYLLQSLKNRLFDIHEADVKHSVLNYDEIILENENNAIDAIIDRETQLEMEYEVNKSLRILSPKQRKIVFWHYKLNLSTSEIATILDTHPDTVRKIIYRALKKMKEHTLSKAISYVLPLITLILLS